MLNEYEVRVESVESGCFLIMTRRQSELYGIKPNMLKIIKVWQKTFNEIASKHLRFNL